LTTDVNEHGSIKINGTELSRVTPFKHLGSTITSDGGLKLEVNARCNGNENATVDGRNYAFGPRSQRAIRQRFSVAPIAEKLREARLRWYGHVLRANDDTVCKIGLNLEDPGKRPRGRPKQRWLDTLHLELKMASVHPDQAFDWENWRHHTRRADPPPSGTDANEEEDDDDGP
uniref:FHA domain-containing protein n=1 Tax=Heligmosomoides polygyrus TaxID=6339 RepID=A0A183GXA0_HELPZ